MTRLKQWIYVVFGYLLLIEAGVASTNVHLLVLYPQSSPAYEAVFNEIISGIGEYPSTTHFAIPISPNIHKDDIHRFIKDNHIDAIISLGKQTYDFAHELDTTIPIVHGGLLLSPNGHSGISLVASPNSFFSHLNDIAPHVKRVYTVYSKENSDWVIQLARESAVKHNIELKAFAATDIRDAVKKFRSVLEMASSSNDAVWLLLDDILPDKTVLPIALEAAWQNRIVLFSNNPSHTKRGALFALFPDHQKMGYSLAKLAISHIEHPPGHPVVLPLDNLKISLNKRTASHLGLRNYRDFEEEIDIIYPLR